MGRSGGAFEKSDMMTVQTWSGAQDTVDRALPLIFLNPNLSLNPKTLGTLKP